MAYQNSENRTRPDRAIHRKLTLPATWTLSRSLVIYRLNQSTKHKRTKKKNYRFSVQIIHTKQQNTICLQQALSGCLSALTHDNMKIFILFEDRKHHPNRNISQWNTQINAQLAKCTSIDNGGVEVPYRPMTLPSLLTKNLVKFHLILEPRNPGLLALRNLYIGAVLGPFTLT